MKSRIRATTGIASAWLAINFTAHTIPRRSAAAFLFAMAGSEAGPVRGRLAAKRMAADGRLSMYARHHAEARLLKHGPRPCRRHVRRGKRLYHRVDSARLPISGKSDFRRSRRTLIWQEY